MTNAAQMRPPHARIHPLEQASNSFGRESTPDALQWRWDFFGGEKNFSLEKKRVHTGRQRAASTVEAVHWIRLTIQLVQWIDFTLHIVAPHFCLLWGKWNAAWLTALAPLARSRAALTMPASASIIQLGFTLHHAIFSSAHKYYAWKCAAEKETRALFDNRAD